MNGLTKLFTLREVAEYLGCSEQTVRREIKAGKLAAIRVGYKPKFTEEIINKYLGRKQKCEKTKKHGASVRTRSPGARIKQTESGIERNRSMERRNERAYARMILSKQKSS